MAAAAAAAAAAGAAPECLSAQIRQVASDDVDMSAANQTASCGLHDVSGVEDPCQMPAT